MSEPYGREAIITDVVIPDKEDNGKLEIRYTSDVLEFYLNGKLVFSGDWQGNFNGLFKRALAIWGFEEGENQP